MHPCIRLTHLGSTVCRAESGANHRKFPVAQLSVDDHFQQRSHSIDSSVSQADRPNRESDGTRPDDFSYARSHEETDVSSPVRTASGILLRDKLVRYEIYIKLEYLHL